MSDDSKITTQQQNREAKRSAEKNEQQNNRSVQQGGAQHQSENMQAQALCEENQAATMPDNKSKWNCEYCTYENFPLSLKCTMCRAVKPLLGEDIYRLREVECAGAAAASMPPPPDNDGWSNADAVSERLRPLRLSPPPTEAPPGVSRPKWSCSTCTFENWPKSLRCAMCGANNSSKHSPPARTQLTVEQATDTDYLHIAAHNETNNKHNSMRLQCGKNDICNSQNATSILDLEPGNNQRRMKRQRQTDWAWLQACLGVVDGDTLPVEQYLAEGGDPARVLTGAEVSLLNRASAFDAGHTLVHLAIRFKREEILSTLLSRISGGGSGVKRAPSYIAPDLATAIRRHVASSLRHKKGSFQCKYIQDFATFSLPAELEELPHPIQEQLFEELLDRDAQQQLEGDPPVINWSLDITVRLGSRLFALWNRSAGDCLLDAVMQAQWGVFDRDNTLRRALADSLHQAGRMFYPRWREYECMQASLLSYSLDESQLLADWSRIVAGAGIAGRSLQQLHVFTLAHIVRRPIIVYGVNVVNSFRGEAIGYARFQGVYLPQLWEPGFCSKSPLCLGYTRGHFSALVPLEPYSQAGNTTGYICRDQDDETHDVTFLPLTDSEGKLLPIHFLTREETGSEEDLLRSWLEVCASDNGLLLARQRLHTRPLLVAQLLEEWLNHYRRIAQQARGPFPPRLQQPVYSSDGDTDEE